MIKDHIGNFFFSLRKFLTCKASKGTYRQWLPVLFFAAITLAIMLPLLGRGYLLYYDMVFSPHVHIDWEVIKSGEISANSIIQLAILKVAGTFLPMDVVQKIILLSVLFFSGYGMYRYAPAQSSVARTVAGMLYVVNPFVYDRFMAGHWLFLVGYSLTPLVLVLFVRFFRNTNRSSLLIAAFAWAAVSALSPHHLVVLGILWLAMAVFYVRLIRSALYSLVLVVTVIVLSSWWLLPLLLIPNVTQSFGYEHFYAFATKPDIEYGLWLSMLSLQGFWYQGWLSIKDFISWWPIAWLAIIAPIIYGLYCSIKNSTEHRRTVLALVLASGAALLLAAGPAPGLYAINLWLFEHVPGMSGLRESQKLLSLVVFAYAFLLAIGIDSILQKKWSKGIKSLTIGIVAVAIMILGWPLFIGGQGQLKVVEYPKSWERFYQHLERNDPRARVVVLPWDIYIEDSFTDRLVANPARSYFGEQVIHSQHMRLPEVSGDGDARYYDIDEALAEKDIALLKDALKNHDIDYLMIVKSRESLKLEWVESARYIKVFDEDEFTTIYRVER